MKDIGDIVKQTIILIPAYNPTDDLIYLIERLSKNNEFKIIVVDDGSNDTGKKIIKKLSNSVVILNHKQNIGKGEALKTGFKYIIKEATNIYGVITVDADGQHSYEDIVKLGDKLKNNSSNVILGVREFEESIPFRSRFGNNTTKLLFKIITGKYISDTQTGLRAIPSMYIKDMVNISGSRYEYEINMLLYFIENKINIDEIKIKTIYKDGNSASNFKAVKDSFKIYKELFKYLLHKESIKFILSSVLAFIIDFVLVILIHNLTATLSEKISLLISVIVSRVISSFINFNINRNIVFKSKNKYFKDLISYYILAIFILCVNYFLIDKIYLGIKLNLIIAKLLTEIIIFIFSFIVQKIIIFSKKEQK